MKTHLVWFRNDLRIRDNPALYEACADPNARVLGLFIATPQQWQYHHVSNRQAKFIYDSLKDLQDSLVALNIPLLYRECKNFEQTIPLIEKICKEENIDALFYNNQYEVNEYQRDRALQKRLASRIKFHEYNGNLLLPPFSILNKQEEMYKIFTPFSRAFLPHFLEIARPLYPIPQKRQQTVTKFQFEPFTYHKQPYDFFEVGEKAAYQRLRNFCIENVAIYHQTRDIPYLDKTSKLSAYLTLGILSPNQCFYALQEEHPNFWQHRQEGPFCWFNELIWRDFYHHLLVAFPTLSKGKPFTTWTEKIQWGNNKDYFEAWKMGKTGYPIIDAAMRQLQQTGWMNNRLRMLTACFLVKDLLIDWHWGEDYFMTQLTDGDFAANDGGWQWSASTGTDALPYFRIFDPVTQGKRFDPQGSFIQIWIPELKQVPDKYIHIPHLWSEIVNKKLNYPTPLVNHKIAKNEAISAFNKARNSYAI